MYQIRKFMIVKHYSNVSDVIKLLKIPHVDNITARVECLLQNTLKIIIY